MRQLLIAFAALVALGIGTAAHAGTPTPTATLLQAPSAPTNLDWFYGPPGSPFRFQLQWQDNSSNEDGFRLEREADRSVVGTYPANTNLGLLPLLDNQKDWCHAIGLVLVAFNAAGESEPSNVVHLLPPPSGCQDIETLTYTNDSGRVADTLTIDRVFGSQGIRVRVTANAPGCLEPIITVRPTPNYDNVILSWPDACVDPGESVSLEIDLVSPDSLGHATRSLEGATPSPTPGPTIAPSPSPTVTPAALPRAGGAPGSDPDSGAILVVGVILILGGSLALKRIR
jgi:hypothetical protein